MDNITIQLLVETATIIIIMSIAAGMVDIITNLVRKNKIHTTKCKELKLINTILSDISRDNWEALEKLEADKSLDINIIIRENIFRTEVLNPTVNEIKWFILNFKNKQYYHLTPIHINTLILNKLNEAYLDYQPTDENYPSSKAIEQLKKLGENLSLQTLIYDNV